MEQTSASLSAIMALPTEIWREVVDRRNRYTEVKSKIDKGEHNSKSTTLLPTT
jgi:hypothetical protein